MSKHPDRQIAVHHWALHFAAYAALNCHFMLHPVVQPTVTHGTSVHARGLSISRGHSRRRSLRTIPRLARGALPYVTCVLMREVKRRQAARLSVA